MTLECLDFVLKDYIGKEVCFDDFSYKLQELGFEDIFDNGYDFYDILSSGVCYFAFVDRIGVDEVNEELSDLRFILNFEVLSYAGGDFSITSSIIKIDSCTWELGCDSYVLGGVLDER